MTDKKESQLKNTLVADIEMKENEDALRNISERRTFCTIMTGYFVLIVVLFAGGVRYPPK